MEQHQDQRTYWSTDAEKIFLDGLGTHSAQRTMSRRALLQRYLAVPRTDWGLIRQAEALGYASTLLAQEQAP